MARSLALTFEWCWDMGVVQGMESSATGTDKQRLICQERRMEQTHRIAEKTAGEQSLSNTGEEDAENKGTPGN